MTHPDQLRTPAPAGRPGYGALDDFLHDAASWDPAIEQVLQEVGRDGAEADLAAAARRVLDERLLTEPGLVYRLVRLLAEAGGLDAGDLSACAGGPNPDRPGPFAEPPGTTIQLTGREAESSLARRGATRWPDGVSIVCITGPAGAGKTRLAREIVSALGGEGPDRRLEVSLGSAAPGMGDRQRATAPHDALLELLTQLGVRASDVPATLEGRRDRYAAELAGRRPVVLIDGAIDESQVIPLLPPERGSVVVTSRSPLTGLFGWGAKDRLRLGPLNRAASRLLAQRAFLALGREPRESVLTAVYEWCHGVPGPTILACRLMAVAAQASDLTVEMLAERIGAARGEGAGGESGGGEGAGAAVLGDLLGADQQAVMGALGLLGLPAADIETVCLATGLDRDRARTALDRLTRIGLVSEERPGQTWGTTPLAASSAPALALWQVSEAESERIIGPVIGLYRLRAESLRDMMTACLPGSPAPLRAWAQERWRAEGPGMRAVLSAAADSGHPAEARQLAAAFMDVAAYAEGRESGWRETEASIAPVLRIASDAGEPGLAGQAAEWLDREARLRGMPDRAVSQPGPPAGPPGDQDAATPLPWIDDEAPVAAPPLLFGAGAGRP